MKDADLPAYSVTLGQGPGQALFLHSSLGSHKALIRLAQLLPYRATLMDLLGHGKSARVNASSRLSDNAAAAAQVFDGPGLVFGHSFGAVTALRFALDHPDRVTRLVLFEPVLLAAAKGSEAHAANDARFAPLAQAFAADDMVAAAQRFLSIWGDGTPWTQIPEGARAAMAERMFIVRDTRDDLEEDATGILAPGVLERLTCPVLLVRGDQSPPVLGDVQTALAARLPAAQTQVLDGEGHMAPVQNPERFAQVISQFDPAAGSMPARQSR